MSDPNLPDPEYEKPDPGMKGAEGSPAEDSHSSGRRDAPGQTDDTARTDAADDIRQPRRQHPVATLTFVLRTLREMIVPIILVFFLGQGGNSPLFTWWGLSLLVSVLLVVGFVSWLRFTWRVEEDELRIEQGLFVRKKRYVPRDRIQAIDVSSGPVQRLFGLVRLNVLTAGGDSPEAEISAITRQDARKIRKALDVEMRNSVSSETATDYPVYRLSRKRLLIAASTAGSFGVALSIVGTLMAQVNQVVSEEQMIAFIEAYTGGTDTEFWITMAAAAVVAAWLLSVFGTLLRFSGFTLSRNDRELQIRRGLFEKKQITIPFHRIQAVRVVEGILRQPFGYAMVYVENAGFGDEGGKTTVVIPLIRKKELEQYFDDMLEEYNESLPGVRPPGRAFLRYQIRTAAPVLAIAALVVWYLGLYSLLPVILVLAALIGYLRYRDAAAGFRNGLGFLRFRRLARSTVIFHRRRIQSLTVLANWFQRRKQLCSVMVTVASGSGGASFRVDHLDESVRADWMGWYGADRAADEPASPAGKWPDWNVAISRPAPADKG
ncbi:PH domain-containing protein [Natronogracilivirga saccharolytica]|nr:PH domain-containing protein [Natronogracilivirga saccharolytica]